MTPEDLSLKKAELEAQSKRHDAKMGVWKVVVGTGIVGLAAAFFPFAQQIATVYFQERIEIIKHSAALQKLREEIQLKRELENIAVSKSYKEFLQNVSREERTKTLDERIVLAEYFVYLSETEEESGKWSEFLKYLIGQRANIREAERKAIELATAPDVSPQSLALAEYEAKALTQSATVALPQTSQSEISEDASISDAFIRLTSGDTDVRRRARSELANLGVGLVRPAMTELSVEPIPYRLRLGLVVALAEMLRRNKANRAEIISRLLPSDLETLIDAATAQDRTLRIHAGEFLYDLGDPRSFNLAREAWDRTADENGKYNLVLIMKGAAPFLGRAERENARRALEWLIGSVGPKTDELIREAIDLLNN